MVHVVLFVVFVGVMWTTVTESLISQDVDWFGGGGYLQGEFPSVIDDL